MARDYPAAVEYLNSLQTNAATLAHFAAQGVQFYGLGLKHFAVHWERLGHRVQDLNGPCVIHIAGTKGKGSTAMFCEALLRNVPGSALSADRLKGLKVGTYTSPHLIEVRERIRVNGQPVTHDTFAKYFFECWDKVVAAHQDATKVTYTSGKVLKPGYFHFLTLLALHTFIREQVDVVILEVGIGGKYDTTNIVPQPTVCGITSLGLDHQKVLGNTLSEIATQKAGIAKPGVPIVSVSQSPEAERAIITAVTEAGGQLLWLDDILPTAVIPAQLTLGIQGHHQIENSRLATALVSIWLQRAPHTLVPCATKEVFGPHISESNLTKFQEWVARGLSMARWPGRSQIYRQPTTRTVWFMDGAHTLESMVACGKWYQSCHKAEADFVLLFNCSQGRHGEMLLRALADLILPSVGRSCTAVFCPNLGQRPDSINHTVAIQPDLTNQRRAAEVWRELCENHDRTCETKVLPTIDAAIACIQSSVDAKSDPTDVLVTGSLHLVGGVIDVLKVPIFNSTPSPH
ncbi:Folylpolyglutamate synthetase [Dispira simplex]|nr:Folylpolyglutamate synthetase [Dispira simplex]